MIRRVWTDAAVALLRELYPNTRTRDLVGILDASERQIYSKASTLGLTKSAEYLASEDSGRLRGQRGVASRFQKGATPWKCGDRSGGRAGNTGRLGTRLLPREGLAVLRELHDRRPLLRRPT